MDWNYSVSVRAKCQTNHLGLFTPNIGGGLDLAKILYMELGLLIKMQVVEEHKL